MPHQNPSIVEKSAHCKIIQIIFSGFVPKTEKCPMNGTLLQNLNIPIRVSIKMMRINPKTPSELHKTFEKARNYKNILQKTPREQL